ncbi:MAG: LysM peptidoglycan-binding domain-containing protein [Opitutaceae bacterium]|jgi:LysM repeat protein
MKIIRIFGIVVGIHVALGVFLAVMCVTPGCSSTVKPSAAIPANTRSKPADSVPVVSLPHPPATPLFQAVGPADATAASAGGPIFYSPTRPGTVAADAVEAQPVAGVTPATTYTVGQGDSWWTIAKKNHLKVSDLAAANNLKPTSMLQPGQKLLIPSKALPEGPAAAAPAAAAPAPSHANPPSAALKHVVRRGETLGSIAHAYGLKIGDLAAANSISDPGKIHPGQELTIPAGGHAARPAKARSGAPAASRAPETSAPAAPAPPAPLPAPEAAPGAGSGPGADVPVIKVEPSDSAAQSAPSNPSR